MDENSTVEPEGAADMGLGPVGEPSTEIEPQEPEGQETPSESAETAPEQGEAETPPERSAEGRRAIETLRLRESGPPQSVLDAMSDAEAIAWADRQAPTYRTIDQTFLENASLKKELADLKAAHAESEAANSAEQATPAALPDLDIDWSQLTEALGVDEGEGREVLDGTIGNLLRTQQQSIASLQKALERQGEHYVVDNVLAGMAEEYSDLADPEFREGVKEWMLDLAQAPRFGHLEGVNKAKALALAGIALQPQPAKPAPPDPRVETAKRNGSPSDPTPSREPKGPEPELSFTDRLQAAGRVLNANKHLLDDPIAAAKHLRQTMGG